MPPSVSLVVGAAGATGRDVVQKLLDRGQIVKVIVRSKRRLLDALAGKGKCFYKKDQLIITEGSILHMTDAEIRDQVKDVDAVVSCMECKGFWKFPLHLLSDVTKRLTAAMKGDHKRKFIFMASDAVNHPDGTDVARCCSESTYIFLQRLLVPYHLYLEESVTYLYSLGRSSNVEWAVVRPTDLTNGAVSNYILYDKPVASLFSNSMATTRSNVASCMVDFIMDDKKWRQWKYQMPVLAPTEQSKEDDQ